MIRSFYALQSVDPGFDPHNVLSMVVSVSGTKEASAGRREIFYRESLEKIKTSPGVEAVGGINHLPLEGDLWDRGFEIEGRSKSRPGEVPDAVYRIVMPGYFETMRLKVERGRTITYQDNARAQAVVVINQRTAERFWPGENPIGKRIVLGGQSEGEPNWLTIVGVTANASLDEMVSPPYPELYLPALQTPAFLGVVNRSDRTAYELHHTRGSREWRSVRVDAGGARCCSIVRQKSACLPGSNDG